MIELIWLGSYLLLQAICSSINNRNVFFYEELFDFSNFKDFQMYLGSLVILPFVCFIFIVVWFKNEKN